MGMVGLPLEEVVAGLPYASLKRFQKCGTFLKSLSLQGIFAFRGQILPRISQPEPSVEHCFSLSPTSPIYWHGIKALRNMKATGLGIL